jgi:hypothetical protein
MTLAMNLFNLAIAALTGELPWLTALEKAPSRVERPRREPRVRVPRGSMPRHGFRGRMRGMK